MLKKKVILTDVDSGFNLCKRKREALLLKTVRDSAKHAKDHGEMAASLKKWFIFLAARAEGWSSDVSFRSQF